MFMTVLAGASTLAGSLGDNNKDPARLADNTTAFNLARQGRTDALLYLKHRSGRFGPAYIGPLGIAETPGSIGGWATETAKQDAWSKYATLAGESDAPSPNAPAVSPLRAELDALAAEYRSATATTLQRISAGGGAELANQIDPNATRVSVPVSSSNVMMLAGVALVAWLVFSRK